MLRKTFILGFVASFLATIIFWIFFISFIFGPDYFIERSYPGKYVIASSEAISSNANCFGEIGHLVSKGIIVDVKEIWAFQGGYYGTLISVLIAAIGTLGAVAFVYIKSISLEKLEEAADKSAKDATLKITSSFDFLDRIFTKMDDKIDEFGEENGLIMKQLEENVGKVVDRLKLVEAEISKIDRSENAGSDLEIEIGEN